VAARPPGSDDTLAEKLWVETGRSHFLQGDVFPANLELNIRGIFHSNPDNKSVYFNSKYVEEALPSFKGQAGNFWILADSPADVSKIAIAVDAMFHNSPQPTKTETEKQFGLEFTAMLGNVKAFILIICSAVVFTTLPVSATTIAVSIRERTRELAVLKALGSTPTRILRLFVSESVGLSLAAEFIGACHGEPLVYGFGRVVQWTFLPLRVTPGIWALALLISGMVGLLSSALPSYHASRIDIVDGLGHIG
jgi:putative ABC transport system permease protein